MNAITNKISLSAIIFALLLIGSSTAIQPQQSYNKILLNPYYRMSMTANTEYTYIFSVDSKDGFLSVISALIQMNVYVAPTVNVSLTVNNKICNTPFFYISTSMANAGLQTISFDCSNVINRIGNYTVKFKSTKDTSSTTGFVDLTYINNPISLEASGTEYQQYDNGTVFVRLLDGNSIPVNLASCNALSYYPNRTSIFFNTSMTLLEKGIYYKDFTLENVVGNYITIFDCVFPASKYYHIKIIDVDIGASNPSYLDAFPFDDSNNVTINSAWIFYNVTGGGGGASNSYYFNGVLVETAIGVTQIVNVTLNQSNFIFGESQEFSIIRTSLSSKINSVRLYVNFTYNSPLTTIRGQDEIHVGNIMSNINVSLINNQNNTAVLNAIANMNNTINSSFIGTNNLIANNIESLNNSMNNSFIGLKNDILSVNQSIWYGLNSINSQLNTVSSQLASVNNSVLSMNSSLSSQLSQIQNQIVTVNNTLYDMNISIYSNQQLILSNLSSIQTDLTSISNQIAFTNSTIHLELTSIENQITVMNTTMISNFNSIDSNMASNFTFTNNLINSLNFTYMNNLIVSVNSTIMAKLYAIQNEISSVNNTVINGFNDLKISINNQFNNLVNLLVNPFVNAVNSITGNTDSANRVFGITTGVSGQCSLGNRIIGKC